MDIRPVELSPEGIERTHALLQVVFPHARHITPTYLERLYKGNPLGPTTGFSVFEGNDLVAHYLMVPILALVHGNRERGIWPFQFATHPEYRGKRIFSTLVEASVEEARKNGYRYLSGVGNAQSTPILMRRPRFRTLCQLDVKVGFGLVPPPQEMPGCQFRRLWDRAGIAWRLGVPGTPYRVKRKDGFAHLYADSGVWGIRVEVGTFPEDIVPETLEPLSASHPLRLWIGKDAARDWSGTWYFDVPERFKPSPLYLIWCELTDHDREFEPDKIQYDLFNFDAY
jgi:GNAT superfamily N-acetyltransferase